MDVRLPPFQALLDRHRDDVYRFVHAVVGPDDADDCFQETFLSALRAYPQLRDASNLRSWLLTIAYRKAMDVHRARTREPRPVASVPDGAANGSTADDHALWELVRGLPPKQRAAVAGRYGYDLRYAELARVIGCSEEAARQNVRQALRTLRERIA